MFESTTYFNNDRLKVLFSDIDFQKCVEDIERDFSKEYSIQKICDKVSSFIRDDMTRDECYDMLVKAVSELTSSDEPLWEFIAARFLNVKLHKSIKLLIDELDIRSFSEKVKFLAHINLYGKYIVDNYTDIELDTAASFINNSRDKLLNVSGLDLLMKRYLIRHGKTVIETPQEMFLGIALHLAMNEKTNRLWWVRKFYDMLSTLEVTMATPTMSNARKPYCQLSSCFIDTVPDSLNGIYHSIDNFAKVSKLGGGMGMYFGHIRAKGSDIRAVEGCSGGTIRWLKIVNDTAVAVDQLGVRSGAVAVYLDIWHKDIPEFLNIRTNNGDDRMKAHDVFPGICYPDLFWKLAKNNIEADWHMMCPHEILKVKGYRLEDYYGSSWEKRYWDCVADDRIEKRTMPLKSILRLILRSSLETGTPFVFNRDTVNKYNPNSHKGIIYCSNLCTEIAQNMSEIQEVSTSVIVEVEKDQKETIVVTKTKPGDFVVCNLASLTLGRINTDDHQHLEDIISTAIRAIDNVISLNYFPVKYAELTSEKYRAVGLGASGWHHLLAKKNILWESQEHLEFADKLFERINYYAINASRKLAKERGPYEAFKGSEWETGEYFRKRNYISQEWQELAAKVERDGLRSGYLITIAPTSSTSIISGTTAGMDPVLKKWFLEEKKGNMLVRTAPDLSEKTWWFYKEAFKIDQEWSIRSAGIRQRHIDQSQSVNLYITHETSFRQFLNLYILAWEIGVKTLYYTRSKSLEVEECESCSS